MRDMVLVNGTILTMTGSAPEASPSQTLAVRGGKVLAVGTEDQVREQLAPDPEVIDLAGACVLPGFHDSHVHHVRHGFELAWLRLDSVATLPEALEAIKARAAQLPEGTWLLGSGFAMARWGVTSLHKRQLDAVVAHHPVYLQSQDHHSAWVNSEALRRAGVTAATSDPENGVIVREDGEVTGVLLEHAQALVQRAIPTPSDADILHATDVAADHFASLGITTTHSMAMEPPNYWRLLGQRASQEEYKVRVWACIPQEDIEHAQAIGLATAQGGPRFQVGGAKFFSDGALGSLTAWMLQPYQGTHEYGMAVHGPEEMAARFPLAIEAGLTPVIHAIGDRAIHEVLNALEATRHLWEAKGMRPRLEHAQHIHLNDLPRFAALGIIASMQPIHLVFDAKRIRELLSDRLSDTYRFKSLLESGAVLALGSDTPVAPPDIVPALKAATSSIAADGLPLNPNESLSPWQALAGYTKHAAYAIRKESCSGVIKAGFDADLVILNHDPLQTLEGLKVNATMMDGRWTFQN